MGWLDVIDGYWLYVGAGVIGLVLCLNAAWVKVVGKILEVLFTGGCILVVLAVWIGLVLGAWGGLHYFLGVPAPSILPFPEPNTASSPSAEFESADSLTQDLEERAKEMYKHIDGSESGWGKTYKYLTPEFRSQCTKDEFVEAIMTLSALFIGWGAKYKMEILDVSASEHGLEYSRAFYYPSVVVSVGTVMVKFDNESYEEADSETWIKVDGTWWNAFMDEDDNNLLSLACQD